MRKTENEFGKLVILDKWLILFVLLLLVTLTLFVLDYFPGKIQRKLLYH